MTYLKFLIGFFAILAALNLAVYFTSFEFVVLMGIAYLLTDIARE